MLEKINRAVVWGHLVKKDIATGKNVKGDDYIRATLTIRTSPTQDVEVKMYSAKLTKEGKENSNYKGIETIQAEYKTIEKDGVGEAVKVNSGELTMNRYKDKNSGLLRENFEIKSNFCSRVEAKDLETFVPKAEFEVSCFVKSGVVVADKEGNFDNYKMTVVVPMFGDNNVEEFELLVRDEQGANFMSDNFTHGTVGVFNGDIIKQVETIELASTVAQGWGRESKSTKTIRRTELLIRGCSEVADEYPEIFSAEEIKKGLENLEKKRVEAMSKADTNTNTATGGQATRTFSTGQAPQNGGFAPMTPVAPVQPGGQGVQPVTPVAPVTPQNGFNPNDIPF